MLASRNLVCYDTSNTLSDRLISLETGSYEYGTNSITAKFTPDTTSESETKYRCDVPYYGNTWDGREVAKTVEVIGKQLAIIVYRLSIITEHILHYAIILFLL